MKTILILLFNTLIFNINFSQVCYTFTPTNSPLSGNNVIGIYIDNDGSKWFATNNGAFHYHSNGWDFYNTINSGISADWLRDITRAGNNDLFFATNVNGVSRYDGTIWTTYTQANGLPSNTIYDIITDSNGDVWVATANGIARFNGTSWEIKNTSNTSAFPSPTIKAITEDDANTIWMAAEPSGSWQGGASYFNSPNSCTNYTTFNSSISDNSTQAILKVNPTDLWIGSWSGISILDVGTNMFTNYSTANSTLPSDYVSDIAVDLNSRVWVGTNLGINQGLVFYDYSNGTWNTALNTSNSCLESNTINDIEIDNNGNVWVGTTYGATVLNDSGINTNGNFNSISISGEPNICEGDSSFIVINADGGFGTLNFDISGLGSFQNWNERDTIWYTPSISTSYSISNISDALGKSPTNVGTGFSQILSPSYTLNENISICNGDSYQLPNGSTVNSSGSYNSFFSTIAGCDSTIITNVTLVTPNISVTSNDTTLTSNAFSATYQWIQCNNGNDPISGATSSTYTPTFDGTFAVIVEENGCVDTSACILINVATSGLSGLNNQLISIFPNPSSGKVFIKKQSSLIDEILIIDVTGRIILQEKLTNKLELNLLPGTYQIIGLAQNQIMARSKLIISN